MDLMSPVVLIEDMGNDDLGDTADGAGGRGSGSTVMDHGAHAGKKVLVRVSLDEKNVIGMGEL